MKHTDALSQIYAKSLYELAEAAGGQDKIVEIEDELEQICELARADKSFREFLSGDSGESGKSYTVKFVNAEGTRFLTNEDPLACPISLEELAKSEDLASCILNDGCVEKLGTIESAQLVVLHCSTCDRRLIVDGVHRAVWLARYGNGSEPVVVFELSGDRWAPDTPDMNIVCQCIRQQHGTSSR